MNIYSLVVRVAAERVDEVKASLITIPGLEVHQEHEGRIIVTVEDVAGYRTSDALVEIQCLDGIISTTLAYEYCDDELVFSPNS
ncbi:chaperone NapD [Chitinibacter fontanus]|uniref:Chaperone NapD n=1 Tax=Chitinibacter fontanus TaxID=1737446 RepID=A0A7D5VAG5_9NEIS|nr:chaperone NapD [Chitinibacter fontanus]QLI82159.1 chaperone NapD [Chitinibacter fontanus]